MPVPRSHPPSRPPHAKTRRKKLSPAPATAPNTSVLSSCGLLRFHPTSSPSPFVQAQTNRTPQPHSRHMKSRSSRREDGLLCTEPPGQTTVPGYPSIQNQPCSATLSSLMLSSVTSRPHNDRPTHHGRYRLRQNNDCQIAFRPPRLDVCGCR